MRLLLLVCGLLAPAWALPAPAPEALQAQAIAHVRQSLLNGIPSALQAQVHWSWKITGLRGAALRPCAGSWQWGPLPAHTSWQRVHVPVRCNDQTGSLVVMPQATAPRWRSIRSLSKGHLLQASDVQQHAGPVRAASDLVQWDALAGMALKENIAAGAWLGTDQLERPVYARKGQLIEIRATYAGITVSVQGTAMQTARKGDTIRVRNVRSKQWVRGTLIAPGVLEAQAAPEGATGVKVIVESSD